MDRFHENRPVDYGVCMAISFIFLGVFVFCMIQSMRTNHRWEEAASKAMQTTEVVRQQRDTYAYTLKRMIEKDKVYYLTHPDKETRETARAILDNTFEPRVLPNFDALAKYYTTTTGPRRSKKRVK